MHNQKNKENIFEIKAKKDINYKKGNFFLYYFWKDRKKNDVNWKILLLIIIHIIYILIHENENEFKVRKPISNYSNYINVAYAFDNNYYYITQVSMKSIMLNQNNDTFIKFYILVHESIFKEQKTVIDTICLDHKNCNISYLILKDEFKDISIKGIIKRTTAIYYRLLLQNLLKNENKTLYFDCDTLIYKDLTVLYNYDIKDKYYVGRYEGPPLRRYSIKLNNFINSGVMLINLKNLRKDNIYKKTYQFLRKNNKSLVLLDQDAINVVCNKKLGFFPFDYVSAGVCDSKIFKILIKEQTQRNRVKNLKEPYIFHFISYIKPWYGIAKKEGMICYDLFPRFYEYARKTRYYFEILEKFKVFDKK